MTGTAAGTIARTITLLLGLALLSACALLSPAQVDDAQTFTLNPPASDLPRASGCAALTLLVLPPQAPPSYDTTRMAYATGAHQVAYFGRHQWADTPSQMLLPLLVKALQDTHCFGAVVAPPYAQHYTHALQTDIVELLQDFGAQPATLRLALRVQLSDTAGRVIVATEVMKREPLAQGTAEAGVAAANKATAAALREVVTLVLVATSSARSRP